MLQMNNWAVNVPKGEESIGYDGENLVYRLQIQTDSPSEWAYKLDIRYSNGKKNFLDLNYTDGVLWTDIKREMLVPGSAKAQVRATLGEQEKHSNIFGLRIDQSIRAVNAFSGLEPSAFEQMEQRMSELKLAAEAAAKESEDSAGRSETAAQRAEDAADRAEAGGGAGGGNICINGVQRIVFLDRVEYDSLEEKDAGTLYLIKG